MVQVLGSFDEHLNVGLWHVGGFPSKHVREEGVYGEHWIFHLLVDVNAQEHTQRGALLIEQIKSLSVFLLTKHEEDLHAQECRMTRAPLHDLLEHSHSFVKLVAPH